MQGQNQGRGGAPLQAARSGRHHRGGQSRSRIYVNHKKKDCAECGIYSEEYALPECARQEEVLELIDLLNGREDIDGILVQLPLPPSV